MINEELILENIKEKLTGYDSDIAIEYDIDYSKYLGQSSSSYRNRLQKAIYNEYPEEMFRFFETLCSILPNNVTLDELLLNMELLIQDLKNGKCGFYNNSNTKERFKELNTAFQSLENIYQILSYIPKYIDEIADSSFSTEFSKRFSIEILDKYYPTFANQKNIFEKDLLSYDGINSKSNLEKSEIKIEDRIRKQIEKQIEKQNKEKEDYEL